MKPTYLRRASAANLSRRCFHQLVLATAGAGMVFPRSLAAQSASPTRGGRIVVTGSGSEGETLNPFNTLSTLDEYQAQNLYDGLAYYDPSGAPQLRLAERIEGDETAQVWTVTLKQGVLFHDGSEMTSADVVHSFRRMLDPVEETEAGGFFPFLDPDGVEATGPYEVRFSLNEPNGDFLSALAEPGVLIIREGLTDYTQPNGTGPFRMDTWEPGVRTILARHDGYHQEGLPYLDAVELRQLGDDAKVNALLAGQVDFIGIIDSAQAQLLSSRGLTIVDRPAGNFFSIAMDVTQPPFDDNRVRRALRMLIDREQIVQNVFLGNGAVGNDLYGVFDPVYASEIPQMIRDVEGARALLAEAGVPDLTFELHTAPLGPNYLPVATIFTENAREAGVTIEIVTHPADTYWDAVWMQRACFQTEWRSRPWDAQTALITSADAAWPETNWQDDRFDALVLEARSTADPDARRALLVEAQEILFDSSPYIYPVIPTVPEAMGANVQGHVAEVYPTNRFANHWLET